jgi:pimeloyl-ACP methyl ester carboxylesterase
MMPNATKEQADAFNELQRLSASSEVAVRYLETVADLDVREYLPHVKAPTLVMHVRGDRRIPIDLSRELAANIPGARVVVLPGMNHILLEQDPCLPRFFDEFNLFFGRCALAFKNVRRERDSAFVRRTGWHGAAGPKRFGPSVQQGVSPRVLASSP